MTDYRKPMPSRDKYTCKDCAKRKPACQGTCPEKMAIDKTKEDRKAIERKKRYAENAATEYCIERQLKAQRKKFKER